MVSVDGTIARAITTRPNNLGPAARVTPRRHAQPESRRAQGLDRVQALWMEPPTMRSAGPAEAVHPSPPRSIAAAARWSLLLPQTGDSTTLEPLLAQLAVGRASGARHTPVHRTDRGQGLLLTRVRGRCFAREASGPSFSQRADEIGHPEWVRWRRRGPDRQGPQRR